MVGTIIEPDCTHIENYEKLDSNVDYIYNSGDLSSFLYEKYDEEDYIRDYDEFLNYRGIL